MNYKYSGLAPVKEVKNIDLDGVLSEGYDLEAPIWENIEKVRRLHYDHGHTIIIWTARLWWEAPKIAAFLEEHQIPYHGIKCNKGGSNEYVDDRATNVKDWKV